jgi:hypothetical protein
MPDGSSTRTVGELNAMGKSALSFLLLCLLALTLACVRSADREEQRSETATSRQHEEWFDEMVGDIGEENRETIRGLAQEYAHTQIPGSIVRGVSTTLFTGNLYLVSVDVMKDDVVLTMDLVARRFYPPDPAKTPYWRVDPLSPNLSRALSGVAAKRIEREKEASTEP